MTPVDWTRRKAKHKAKQSYTNFKRNTIMEHKMENGELYMAVYTARKEKTKQIMDFLACHGKDKLSDNLKSLLANYTDQLLDTILAEAQFDAMQEKTK